MVISHHWGSQLRSFCHRTLALIAPRLTFDEDLIERLEAGLKRRYFVMSPPLALYAVSQGYVSLERPRGKEAAQSGLASALPVERLIRRVQRVYAQDLRGNQG